MLYRHMFSLEDGYQAIWPGKNGPLRSTSKQALGMLDERYLEGMQLDAS